MDMMDGRFISAITALKVMPPRPISYGQLNSRSDWSWRVGLPGPACGAESTGSRQ